MPNYKTMYLKMLDASEKAINLLIEAQRECEELYLAQEPPALQIEPSCSEENFHTKKP